MTNFKRTHHLGELRSSDIGKTVRLSGWVHRRRDHGGVIFIDLRDRFGLTQLVFHPDKSPDAHQNAEKLRSEFVVTVEGLVIPRAEGMANPNLPTGDIEIEVKTLHILSKAKTPPFSISDDMITVNEELRLEYRYLDIRRGDIAEKLIKRHQAMQAIRQYLSEEGFLEIHTPIMGKSTPEGARDYLVPSRVHPGHFYALPQSPQLFKQILMVAGMDRYFQIAQCFRDEDLRADRQPEFTQIDMEMSFETPDKLFSIIEGMLKALFETCVGAKIKTPFLRLTHAECKEKYGTDKPDLRFEMPLIRIDDIAEKCEFSVFRDQIRTKGIVKGLCVKGGSDISRKGIDQYTDFVAQFGVKGLAWMKRGEDGLLTSSITKFFSPELQQALIERFSCENGDLIFMVADDESRVNQSLDHLRRRIARERHLIQPHHYSFLWVIDFPLFAWNVEENRLDAEHHPFTSPLPEDIALIDTKPLAVRSSSYDLVLNGYELASGSQRIHDSELQQKIFEILKLSKEELEARFGFFIEALSYGTPPHLGAALGFDRLMMILTGTENIRDVIAFPKTQKASDLMMDCPSTVSKEQLRELSIKTTEEVLA